MERQRVCALALLGAALATTSTASTASSSVPSSTASYRAVTVSGATVHSLDYTVTAGLVTGVRPRLRSTRLLTTTVRARYGSGPAVLCTAGLLTVLDLVTGLREGTYTCTGLAEPAGRPRELHLTVS